MTRSLTDFTLVKQDNTCPENALGAGWPIFFTRRVIFHLTILTRRVTLWRMTTKIFYYSLDTDKEEKDMNTTIHMEKMPKVVQEFYGTAQKTLTTLEGQARQALTGVVNTTYKKVTDTIGLATKQDLKSITNRINKLRTDIKKLTKRGKKTD